MASLEYPKIQSIFKRDERSHKFLFDQFSHPAFGFLRHNQWGATEKVDGMNIRVEWHPALRQVVFNGKTDNAQIPATLIKRLHDLFPADKFPSFGVPLALYGEGYGAKIQKGGGNYKADGQDFVLFDVLIDGWWLERENVEDVASKLGVQVVPVVFVGTLDEAVEMARAGFNSEWGDFMAEGLVLKPAVALHDRRGKRVITKVKHRDF